MTALEPAPAAASRRSGATPDLAAIRADLEAQRRFRVEQLTELAATVTCTGADGPRDEVASTLKAAAFTVLVEIDAALNRIELDCYGVCQRCGEAISPDRLEALPMASLCMPCQYAKEASGDGRMQQPPERRQARTAAGGRRGGRNRPRSARRGSTSSDMVDHWGNASFPASDPPQNW